MTVAVLGVTVAPAPAQGAPVSGTVVAADEVKTGDGDASGLTAPDAASATAIARLEGAPVEVLAERTESGSVFVLPDGTRAAAVGSGPVWVRRGGDGTHEEDWAPVDLTLRVSQDGRVRPVAQAAGLTLDAGGESQVGATDGAAELATLMDPVSGRRSSWQWPGLLPAVELSGRRATYRDVRPGVDLVIEATNTGFEQYLVLNQRPAADADLSFSVSMQVENAQLSEAADGGLVATDDGEVVATTSTAMMWDAVADAGRAFPVTMPRPAEAGASARLAPMPDFALSADHGISAKVRASAEREQAAEIQAGKSRALGDPSVDVDARSVSVDAAVENSADDTARITLMPQRPYLDDPSTVYPVVIDPTPTIGVAFDTYVMKGYSNTRSTETQMHVGYDGAGHIGRAFLTFPLSQILGAQVSSATVNLMNFYSWSCQARQWDVHNTDPANAGTIWTNQPAWGGVWGSVNVSHGYNSTCPGGWSSADITGLAGVWAAQSAQYGYVGIMAANESDSYGWKKFYASDNGSYFPTLWVAYNYPPDAPAAPTLTAGGSTVGGVRWVNTTTPTVSTTVNDRDGGAVTVRYEIKQNGVVIRTQDLSVQSGYAATYQIPAGVLANGGSYEVWAAVYDGMVWSPWSGTTYFSVDTAAPGAPRISSSDYPADEKWHKDANQAGAFTFSMSPGDVSVVGYQWGLDQAPQATQQVSVSNGAAGVASITPTAVGRHTLQVKTIDRSGNLSAQVAKYSFLVGRAGILTPDDGAKVVRRARISVGTNDSTLTYVKYQWRRGPDSATVTDVAAGALTTSAGQPLVAGFNPMPTAGGYATWDAAMTLGYAGGPVQVRAVLATSAAGAGVTYTQWVTVTIDPDADGAATADVGPGSVNLLTGDYKVTVTDAEEFGLSVLRTTSSRDTDSGYQLQPDQLSATQRDGTYNAAEWANSTATVSSATNQFHQGATSYKLTATASGTTDTYAAVGGDVGALRVGLVGGATYRISAWVYVPGATGLSPGSVLGESVAVYARVGSAGYMVPGFTPRPTKVDTWQERTVDVTLPAGATEAFVRLVNGFDGATGKVVYFDDLSIRRIWAPFGVAWSMGSADQTAGTAYTKITQPYDDVAAVGFATGGDVWFSSGDGTNWYPEPGAEDLKLTRTSNDVWRLTESDGTFTDFTRTAGSSGDFTIANTAPPAVPGQARYIYAQTAGLWRLSRIIAPIEAGVDGWVDGRTGNLQACTSATPAVGCEVLDLTYATTTTATPSVPGSFAGQVSAVTAWVYNGAAMVATPVTSYGYTPAGQLVTVQDPRVVAAGALALPTTYTYDSAGRLASLTPAGELGYTFGYGVAGAQVTGAGDWIDPSPGRLLSVSRASLVPGTADQIGPVNVSSVVYAVPLTTTTGGPYDLSPAALATWAQSDGPTDATALFGPQNPPAVSTATATSPGPGGYAPAAVHYLNASGLEVNTASPAGPLAPAAGYIDVAEYDTTGKVVRTLDATNRLLALGQLPDAATSLAGLGLTGKTSVEIATLLDTRNTYSPDGLDLLTVTGPADRLAVANNPGDIRLLRPYVVNVYDQGKPDGAAYHLVTTSTSSGRDPVTGEIVDASTTVNGYNPIDGASALGGSSGWLHGTPTTVTIDSGGANALTSKILLDAAGRPISSRMPGSNGADAGTVASVYYSAAANPSYPECGGRPQWAGQACLTKVAGTVAVAPQDANRVSSTLPVRQVTGYDGYGNPTAVKETASGPVDGATVTDVRTTTTTYDAAGRVTAVEITGTGAGVGTPVAKTTTVYDPANGEVARIQSRDTSGTVTSEIVKAYDKLGRLVSYTDATGGSTTTSYDRYGRPTTVSESLGTSRSYTYDDPRGYATSVNDSLIGTITAAWGPDGQLTSETLPGDMTLTIGYNAARTPVARTYTRTSDGTTVASDRGTLNQRGQWIIRYSNGRSLSYQYDSIGRLTRVDDASDVSGLCQRSIYGYDTHSNRVGFGRTANVPGDPCPPEPTTNTVTTYDAADRLLTTAGSNGSSWTYDPFGRITTMPTADGSATVVNAYYVNDQIASQTQTGAARVTWGLDPIQRRSSVQTDRWVDGVWASSVTRVSHYGSDSDEPVWISEDASVPVAVTRYVSGVDGDLVATTSTTGDRVVQLIDLHGDVMGTVPIADGAAEATWIGLRISLFDEFGNPMTMTGSGSPTGPPARYGWLGADQRSAEALGGVILMGKRLYLPTTGRFLSVDPVPGGSANAYDYCNADPVNCADLDGTFAWKKFAGIVAAVASVASIIPGPVGMAASAVAVVGYAVAGDKKQALIAAAGIALAAVGAGAAVAGTAIAAVKTGAAAKVASVAVDAHNAVRVARAAKMAVENAPGIGKELTISARGAKWAERLFVGKGARTTSVGGKLSADGLRQTRPATFKSVGYVQMNFQSRKIPSGKWLNNYHVRL